MAETLWWVAGALAAVGGGAFALTRTTWFQLRLYGAKVARAVQKHQVQQKAEALQRAPDPLRAKKQLQELAQAYRQLTAELEKIVPPKAAAELHQETLAVNRKAAELYQLVAAGTFREKELRRRQAELQRMERSLRERVAALYGKKALELPKAR